MKESWNLNPFLREFEPDVLLSRTLPEAIEWFEHFRNLLKAVGFQNRSTSYYRDAVDIDCDNPAYERLETVERTIAQRRDLIEAIDTVSFVVNLLKGITS